MVKESKINKVEELANLISKFPSTGILDLYKIPASVLQKLKRDLYGKAEIKVAKKSILLFALEKANRQKLKEHIGLQPALILTNMDPFKLSIFLDRNKSPVAAKPGDIAIKDIEVKVGPTDLPPGPAITTLTKVGIPARVEAGKIAIFKDKVVAKTGEKISLDLASALQLLKLKPMEIGLKLVALQEHDKIYTKDQLFINLDKIINDLTNGARNAFNLSVNSGYPTKQTIEFLLVRAYLNAKQIEMETKGGKPL